MPRSPAGEALFRRIAAALAPDAWTEPSPSRDRFETLRASMLRDLTRDDVAAEAIIIDAVHDLVEKTSQAHIEAVKPVLTLHAPWHIEALDAYVCPECSSEEFAAAVDYAATVDAKEWDAVRSMGEPHVRLWPCTTVRTAADPDGDIPETLIGRNVREKYGIKPHLYEHFEAQDALRAARDVEEES